MAESQVAIDQAEKAAEVKRAAEKVAAQERLVRLDQLRNQVENFIAGYQWEKALQVVQQAASNMGSATEISQSIAELQTELTSLITLRTSVAARLKAKPSPPLALATKTGELHAQVTAVDASTVSLRQILGTTGFAETTVSWTDLTPASASRILMLNLDSNNADDLFGYATLLTHQALTKQARIEDARKTLQILAQRSPDRGPWVERYLTRLAELESKTVTPLNPAPETPRAIDAPAAKGYVALDISGACNASFFEHGDHGRRSDEFSRKTYISGLPDDGRVPLRDTAPGGAFLMRTSDKPDSIGITWSSGRFPNTVTMKLPVTQQRKYLRLAILSAASVGSAVVKVQLAYDNATTAETRLRIYDWAAAQPPDEAHRALAVRDSKSSHNPRQLYLDLIDLDAQRRLTAITFAWISTKTEDAQHCVGIFAISALPAEPAR
jgi:hypothetical protein